MNPSRRTTVVRSRSITSHTVSLRVLRATLGLLTLAAVAVTFHSRQVLASAPTPAAMAPAADASGHGEGQPGPATKLSPAMLAELDAYAVDALGRFGIPGAAVAVVQGGRMIHAQGFGVAELGRSQPVTPDTRFLIGSVGKGMTAQMIGTLVDEGILTWDTRVIDVLPQFRLVSPASTETVTFRDLLSMRSGLPRNDVPVFFAPFTAAQIIDLVAETPLLGAPGDAYGYSNTGYSVAGFAAAAAVDGPGTRDLGAAYLDLMRQRFFEPVGMHRLTTDFDAGAADANRAASHVIGANGQLSLLSLDQERAGSAVLPAGGTTWATVEDLAAYVGLQLRHGMGTDGRRVVSESALVETWKPVTPMEDGEFYGLGWITTDPFHGLQHLIYNGGNFGYSSFVSFLPEADLGVAVLVNTTLGLSYMKAVTEYAYELAFALPHEADARRAAQAHAIDGLVAEFNSSVGEVGDPTSVAPLVGDYGDVVVRFDAQGRFVLTNAFGDLPLLPLAAMERTYSIVGVLGLLVQFNTTPVGGMSLTVSRPIGDPQPSVTLIRRG